MKNEWSETEKTKFTAVKSTSLFVKKRFLGLFIRNYGNHIRNRKSGKKAKTNRRNNNPILRNH